MDVAIVGSGPAVEAVEAALDDVDVRPRTASAESIDGADVAVVSDLAGAETFERANAAAIEGQTPWLSVEIGGVGGRGVADLDAAVAGYAPSTGCHECLCARVAATAEDDPVTPSADRGAVRLAGALAGRELVALLAGEESTILGGVVEMPHQRREFLPVPNCDCGDGPDRTLGRDHESVGLEDALARAERGLDERVGLVSTIGEIESFPAPYYLAELASTEGFSDADAPPQAAGVDDDWNPAFMKALGEALERYGAAIYRETEFERARPADLDDAVPPAAFVLPDGVDTDPDAPLPWIEGEEIASGEPAYLPAEKAVFPPPERRLGPSITTGLGLGASTVDALLSGLYEVIERDAAMLSWYSTFEPLELSVDDEQFGALARRAGAEGLAVTPLLVTQDVDVPVVAVAVHREGEWPRFAVGSDADLDPVAAARGALAEALQNWMELRSMGPDDAAEQSGAIGEYADFPEEAQAFLDAGGPIPSDSVGPADSPTGTAELDAVVERATDAGLTPYGVRLTPRDLDAVGFEAVRVLAPSAQPLFTGEPFFGDRARSVPDDLGFEARLDRRLHPYP
ncbi:ribosomal protein S12 methylthiotransferase accessory factor [Natronoarchaeum philippinense]|uniref:Ribosomal protein S12 methylthiotransferase accessory factor n=1 Tax=Natronoarchaeum philippinense TaxID=558529 RepID=A0A285N7R5_NATPI|nr:YcaO-like family protein [Natronoarchaeum philippinense]SNZ05460.1 ribosomal protein S12 methylthiotransferase accessory factor [Natronoarchaeum philippinense]